MYLKILLIAMCSSIAFSVHAQKLPNVQRQGLRAPLNVKVDGNPIEWGNKFQAYNHATDIFYTIANDDDNLYLVIKVIDPVIINKIISAGITFTIVKTEKKDDRDGIAITYPIFDINDKPMIDVKNPPKIVAASSASEVSKADSFMTDNNDRLRKKSKYIKVTGAKDLDTLVSVYNHEGVKAAALFDNKVVYTYELSVDLKHLGLSIHNAKKIIYEIKLNGSRFNALNGITVTSIPQPGSERPLVSMNISQAAMPPSTLPLMRATTNFWGEYTLAKK